MLIDRPQVVEGSVIINATVPSGATFPTGANVGELFYLTTGAVGLYSYTGSAWEQAANAAGLATHIADATKHLTTAQNTLIDGITVTFTDINSIPSLDSRLGTVETGLTTHIADATKHLTTTQNTLLDGLAATLTATELNYVDGVTSSIQTQLNSIVAINTQQSTDISNLQSSTSGNFSSLQAELDAHEADMTVHLTSAQNTWIDAITVGSTDVNKLTGLNSFLGAATLTTYLTNLNTGKLNVDGTNSMTAALNLSSNRIINVADPTSASDAATKQYVDNFVQGLHWVGSTRVASTGNIASLSGLLTIDGVILAINDRVLVKDQSNPSNNGIWLAATGAWTRAGDFNSAIEINNSAAFVLEGETQAKSTWVQTATVTTLGSSPIVFTAFSGPTLTSAGAGLTFPTTYNVALDLYPNGGLLLTSNGSADDSSNPSARLALTNVGTPGTYRSVTTDAKGRVTAGTNPTTIAGYGLTDAASISYADTKLAKSANLSDLASSSAGRTNLGFSVGLGGQAYFITNDASNTVAPGFTLVHGKFVENATELAEAQAGTVDMAAVFGTWYRFSHNTSNTYPAIPSETTSWSFNSSLNRIECTVNSSSYIGFVSPDYYDNYYFKARLASTNTDDDMIGLILGFVILDGREYTLSAIRLNNISNRWFLVYNYSQSDQWIIANGSSEINISYTTGSPTPGGWVSAGIGTVIEASRNGNIITAITSEMGSTTLEERLRLTIDLTSDSRLTKFITPSRVGYSTLSQAASSWNDVIFTSTADAIYDLVNKQKYIYNPATSAWVGSAGTVQADLGVGKFLLSTFNKRLYYVKNSAVVTNVLGADATTYVKRTGDTMSGSLQIGTGIPADPLFDGALRVRSDTGRAVLYTAGSATLAAAGWNGYRARGTPELPAALANDDAIMGNYAAGFTGTTWLSSAALMFRADEAWTDTSAGTKVQIQVTPPASITRGTVLEVTGAGVRVYGTSGLTLDGTNYVRNLASGTYTPTLTNTLNIDSSVALVSQWMRVGNIITVSGRCTVDATTTGSETRVRISLPVTSSFTASEQLSGTGNCLAIGALVPARILAVSGSSLAELTYFPPNNASASVQFHFTYQVL